MRRFEATHAIRVLGTALLVALAPAPAPAATPAAPSHTAARGAKAPRAHATAPVDLSAGLPAWHCPVPVERTLENGLRVAVFQNTRLPQVQIQLLLPAGGVEEDGGPSGLAYLTSQLVRQSTTSRDAATLSAHLERLGGTLSSAASRDYATVVASFLSRDFEAGLELVSDIVVNPILTDDDLSRLKSDAQRSLTQLRLNPSSVADEQIWSLAFPDLTYGHAPYGTLESVAGITRDEARAFYRDHWRPDRSLLVIGGDVTPERAFAVAGEWFDRWSGKAVVSPPPAPIQPPAAPRIRIIDRPDSQVTELRLGLVLPSATSKENVALSLATSLLASGPGARLQAPDVRRRFGRELRSTLLQLRDGGLFTCGTAVRADSTGAAIRFLRRQLRDFLSHPPTAAELERAQRVALNTLPIPFETVAGTMSQWMGVEFLGQSQDAIDGLPARIAAVEPAEIADVARNWLNPDHAVIVLVGSAKKLEPQLKGLGQVEVVRLDMPEAGPATMDTVAATPERVRQGREVLDQAIAAHGGMETLRGIHDSIVDAELAISSGGHQFSGHLTQTRKDPFRMAFVSKFETLESTQVLDGLQAWSLAGGNDAVQVEDSVGVAGLRNSFRSDLPHVLLDAAAPGALVVYHGEDHVGNTDVDVLDVKLVDGRRRRYSFDRKTHLLFALDEADPASGGRLVATRRVFHDYRETQGVQWPYMEESLLGNQPAMRMQVKSVKLNTGVPDEVFNKPKPATPTGP